MDHGPLEPVSRPSHLFGIRAAQALAGLFQQRARLFKQKLDDVLQQLRIAEAVFQGVIVGEDRRGGLRRSRLGGRNGRDVRALGKGPGVAVKRSTSSISSSLLTGLDKKASMPASMQRAASSW